MNGTLDNAPKYYPEFNPEFAYLPTAENWEERVDQWAGRLTKPGLLGAIGLTQHLLFSPTVAIGALEKYKTEDGRPLYRVHEDKLSEIDGPFMFQASLSFAIKHLSRFWIGATTNRTTLRKYLGKIADLGVFKIQSEWEDAEKRPMKFLNTNFDLLLKVYERLEKAWFSRGFTIEALPHHKGFVGQLLYSAWSKFKTGLEAKPNRSGVGFQFKHVSKAKQSQLKKDKAERVKLDGPKDCRQMPHDKAQFTPPKPVFMHLADTFKEICTVLRPNLLPDKKQYASNKEEYAAMMSSVYADDLDIEYGDDMRAYLESIPFG